MADDSALSEQLVKALAQGDRIAALTTRASKLRRHIRVREADRVLHTLQQSFTFRQGENLQRALVYSVPLGHAFEAHRLVLLPEIRLVSIAAADGDSEITFRPTLWTHNISEQLNVVNSGLVQAWPVLTDRLLDAQIELSQVEADGVTSHDLQNAPFPVAQTFSGPVNSDLGGASLISARPSALVFAIPALLAPGTSLQVRVTPTFSGVRTSDGRLNEYRIIGLLEGFKRLTQ